jgi:hypothetical protein
MAVKRNGLGKGLDSLIPNKTVKTTEKQANKTQKEKVKVEKSFFQRFTIFSAHKNLIFCLHTLMFHLQIDHNPNENHLHDQQNNYQIQ